LLITQSWMLVSAAVLGVFTLAGVVTPWLLLLLTVILGLGSAMNGPALQAIIPALVTRRELSAAVTLAGVAVNVSRAVGPALGGLLVAAAGSGIVFLLNAVSFLGVMVVIYRWQPTPQQSAMPPEHIFGAVHAGLRYARHAPELLAAFVRAGVFILCASALWALLPLQARHALGLGSFGYGILLGCIGAGAVAGCGLFTEGPTEGLEQSAGRRGNTTLHHCDRCLSPRTRTRGGRDPAEPGRFVESFLVETWVEHLRQHVRATESDRKIEERIRAFHIGGGQPAVTHLIAEYVPG
jgi:hypothetical protein